jgi:hypothetical protein
MKNKMTVEQKRQLIRHYISEGKIKNFTATETASMNQSVCDNLIELAENNNNNNNINNNSNKMNNTNTQVLEAINVLQNAIQNNSGQSQIDKSEIVQIVNDSINDNKRIEELENTMKGVLNNPKLKKRMQVVGSANSGNAILSELNKYYIPNSFNEINTMLLSPPSFGKTYSARKIGEQYDHYIEHNCSEDIDEISNLIGRANVDTSNSGKSFTVVDGKLVEAVRKASNGESVLLMLDEVLRWNDTTQSYFLTFLTGFQKSNNGTNEKWYRIRTSHNDSNGNFEQIECSSKHLHIIAGANLGGIIPVEAFWSRFQKYRIEFSKATANEIAKAICDSYNVKSVNTPQDVESFINSFVDALAMTREMSHKGSVQFPIDFRMLERAIVTSTNLSLVEIKKCLVESLNHCCANWNCDTGSIEQDSINELEKVAEILTK